MATGLVIVLAVAVLTGCSSRQGVERGDEAPAFSAADIHGTTVDLAGMRGDVVVLYFWSSCCSDSLKLVKRIYETNRQYGLHIIAINRSDAKATADYAARNGITFTMIADTTGKLHTTYRATGFPTIYIVDRSGIIREKILGDLGVPYLEKLVQRQIESRRKATESYEKLHTAQ
jgi:peroxiredoxin